MKGSPMRRNFGIGASALHQRRIKPISENVVSDVATQESKKPDFEREKLDILGLGDKQYGWRAKKGGEKDEKEIYSPWRKPKNIGIMPLVSGDKRSISGLSGTLSKSYQPLENLNLSGKLSGSARKFGDNIYSGGNLDIGGEWKPTEDLTIKGGLGGSVRGGGGETKSDKRFNLNLDKKTDWGGFNLGYDSGYTVPFTPYDPDAKTGGFKGGIRFNI